MVRTQLVVHRAVGRLLRGMLVRLLVVALVLHAGCVAPQRPGFERTAYLTMATTDGALLGGVGALLGCAALTGELWQHGGETSKFATGCGIAGVVAGGAGVLYGSLESTSEPDRATWVVVSIPALVVGLRVVFAGVAWLGGKLGL